MSPQPEQNHSELTVPLTGRHSLKRSKSGSRSPRTISAPDSPAEPAADVGHKPGLVRRKSDGSNSRNRLSGIPVQTIVKGSWNEMGNWHPLAILLVDH